MFSRDLWAVILGGSSGFGLATAHKLAAHGMNLCVVHRDRRGAMPRIAPEFEKLKATGVQVLTANVDALDGEVRQKLLGELHAAMGAEGRVRVLLHSVAFGNLKLLVPEAAKPAAGGVDALAAELGVDAERVRAAADRLFAAGFDELHGIASPPAYPQKIVLDEEDLARTLHAMGTSLVGWTQELLARGLFAADARVFGLTSEGNEVAWKGYAAVAAAKVALESLSRAMALELAPYGIRSNVIQAGITPTPAQQMIPGSAQMRASARLRNPFGRLTRPEDVAGVLFLLSLDEAAWINGEVIRVDGGEHISGEGR